jgi:hypothetical protein
MEVGDVSLRIGFSELEYLLLCGHYQFQDFWFYLNAFSTPGLSTEINEGSELIMAKN